MIRRITKTVLIERDGAGGFTLVEIMCVVIVLGIIAALVAPTLAPNGDLSVSAAARIVVADIQYAQCQAIATGSNTYVRFIPGDETGNGGSYSLYADSAFSQLLKNPVTGKGYSQNLGNGALSPFSGVAITGLNLNGANNTVLVFDPLGTPSVCPMSNRDTPTLMSATGSISLGCGSMTLAVSILPDTGEISVSNVQGQ